MCIFSTHETKLNEWKSIVANVYQTYYIVVAFVHKIPQPLAFQAGVTRKLPHTKQESELFPYTTISSTRALPIANKFNSRF